MMQQSGMECDSVGTNDKVIRREKDKQVKEPKKESKT